jgi:hypothetical protein
MMAAIKDFSNKFAIEIFEETSGAKRIDQAPSLKNSCKRSFFKGYRPILTMIRNFNQFMIFTNNQYQKELSVNYGIFRIPSKWFKDESDQGLRKNKIKSIF